MAQRAIAEEIDALLGQIELHILGGGVGESTRPVTGC